MGPQRRASGSVQKRSRLGRAASASVEDQEAEEGRVLPEPKALEPAADALHKDAGVGDAHFQEVRSPAPLQHDGRAFWPASRPGL